MTISKLKLAWMYLRAWSEFLNPVRLGWGLRQLQNIDLLWLELDAIRTRLSSYLGNGTALTYLIDETPIFVNSNDMGPPLNFINGGRYEEENVSVLLSFVRADTVFLDVGANLGYFSLLVGRRVAQSGKVHAFEPHPFLLDLMRRSAHLNGLSHAIELHPYGLSDTNATVEFRFPRGHLGGGSVHVPRDGADLLEASVKRLDDVFEDGFSCDLMKIDVEGHELQVLRGMPRIIANSPDLKIVFENFATVDFDIRDELESLIRRSGFALYAVEARACLRKMEEGELRRFTGYVLASRHEQPDAALRRERFSIYPRQLFHRKETLLELSDNRLVARGEMWDPLFHGPYWLLPKGIWQLSVKGDLGSGMWLRVTTRAGRGVARFRLTNKNATKYFIAERNLVQFECVGHASMGKSTVSIERIDLTRVY